MSCCARCRRGTKAFGEIPCGYDGFCACHQGRRFRCSECGREWPAVSYADACAEQDAAESYDREHDRFFRTNREA